MISHPRKGVVSYTFLYGDERALFDEKYLKKDQKDAQRTLATASISIFTPLGSADAPMQDLAGYGSEKNSP